MLVKNISGVGTNEKPLSENSIFFKDTLKNF